ncbi:hypothetical protein McanCB21832_007527 [Microsporum canis]
MASVTLHVVPIEENDSIGARTINLTYPIYRCIVGRSSKSGANKLTAAEDNLRFDNRVVSRNHAEFYADLKEKQIYLTDTCSMHGTSANDTKLTSKPVLISNDDIVTLGDTVNRGQESFKPVKIRIGVTWENNSPVTPSCDAPATNTFAVPEDGEDSDVENKCDGNASIENDAFIPWQDISSNSDAGIISIRSSPEPAGFETEITSSQASKDADDDKLPSNYQNITLTENPELAASIPAREPFCFPIVEGNLNCNAPPMNGHGLVTAFDFSNPPAQMSTEKNQTLALEDSHFGSSLTARPWTTSENINEDFTEYSSSDPYPLLVKADYLEQRGVPQHFTPMGKVVKPRDAQAHSYAANLSTCSTKRKFSDSCFAEHEESQDLPDAQPRETFTMAESIKDCEDERPRKRVKIIEAHQSSPAAVFARYAATAITGAVVGGIGAVIALASLPPNFFD